MRCSILSFALVTVLTTATTAFATTIHVPAGQPTIQAGIDAAVEGDTVLVADGIYRGSGNVDLDFGGKAIVVTSERGPQATIIYGADSARIFTFHSGETLFSVVNGFTMRNGRDWNGGAIYIESSSPTISNNVFLSNRASGQNDADGGAIYCSASSAAISHNVFLDNCAVGMFVSGGAIYCYNSNTMISNNTFIANDASGSRVSQGGAIIHSGSTISNNTFTANRAWQGGAIYDSYGFPSTVENCILWMDDPDEIDGFPDIVKYSDVQGGWEGEGNIDDDPLFVLPEKWDCRLRGGSPCIDAGDPANSDPDGTRLDMGAYYFNQEDYLTVYMTPDTAQVSPGDQLGVTYTLINRWNQPESFWFLSRVRLEDGRIFPVMGPTEYTIPREYTFQVHLSHDVPLGIPAQIYDYRAAIGLPPSTLYDWDSFKIWVVE